MKNENKSIVFVEPYQQWYGLIKYDGSTRGVVADEPQSDSQGFHREMWARRRDSEIVALRTET